MDEKDLLGAIENEERSALGYHTGELSNQRERALEYYLQQPFGDEVVGRSQVVDSSVRDTIEWMLPALLKIFTASGKAVEFEPVGVEDQEAAAQAGDACNYVFFKQNNGFLVLYQWFKDALIEKNGIVKFYYEEKETKKKETYYGLTDEQMGFINEDNIEVLAHTEYPDEKAAQIIMQQYEQIAQQAAQSGQPVPSTPPIPNLHDIEIEVRKDKGKVCIENLPPEEFLISPRHGSVSLEGCDFCEHRTRKSISDLVEMGYDINEIEDIGSGDDYMEVSGEYLARRLFTEEQFPESEEKEGPSRLVWVREAYITIDYDGDGIAELRRVIAVGNRSLENEETDMIPFAAVTPNVMPHRFIGISTAEEVMDIQLLKSTLWRQTLDNLYLTNNPRHAVLATPGGHAYADLDDLLMSRPGGVVREYQKDAVRPLETNFVAAATFPMFEYLDQQRMNRTGVNQLSSGLDADAINKTARGAVIAENAQAQKIELVARVFAETGVKDLFKGILRLLNKYSMREMMIRMDGKFVPVDPRNWDTGWDVSVSVGLGTGNKDQQLMHIQLIGQAQEKLLMAGKSHMVTDKNLYTSARKLIENAGYKHVEEFITNPENTQPPQPVPSDEQIKQEAEGQRTQMKLQADAQKTMATSQHELMLEKIRSEVSIAVANIQREKDLIIEEMRLASQGQQTDKKLRADAELTVFQKNTDAIIKEAEMQAREREIEAQKSGEREKLSFEKEKIAAPIKQAKEHSNNVVSIQRDLKKVMDNQDRIQKQLQEDDKEDKEVKKMLSDLTKQLGKPKKISVTAPSGNKYEGTVS